MWFLSPHRARLAGKIPAQALGKVIGKILDGKITTLQVVHCLPGRPFFIRRKPPGNVKKEGSPVALSSGGDGYMREKCAGSQMKSQNSAPEADIRHSADALPCGRPEGCHVRVRIRPHSGSHALKGADFEKEVQTGPAIRRHRTFSGPLPSTGPAGYPHGHPAHRTGRNGPRRSARGDRGSCSDIARSGCCGTAPAYIADRRRSVRPHAGWRPDPFRRACMSRCRDTRYGAFSYGEHVSCSREYHAAP